MLVDDDDDEDEARRAPIVLHPAASWRRMLISRRRITKLVIFADLRQAIYEYNYPSTTRNPYGMMMGDYAELFSGVMIGWTKVWLLVPGRKVTHGAEFEKYWNRDMADGDDRLKQSCPALEIFDRTFHYLEPAVDVATLLTDYPSCSEDLETRLESKEPYSLRRCQCKRGPGGADDIATPDA